MRRTRPTQARRLIVLCALAGAWGVLAPPVAAAAETEPASVSPLRRTAVLVSPAWNKPGP